MDMTNQELDEFWEKRAINCSNELSTMGYILWRYDGDTYNWICRHKNQNGSMSEFTLSHKELVKMTVRSRKEYKFYCIGCRQSGLVHCSDPVNCGAEK